jgi:single-strand DNA-binding protein
MSTAVTLTGNLAADPETTFGRNGTAITKLRVATSRRIKKNDEWQDTETTFWRVTTFGKLAENIADSCKKGDPVIIVGRAYQEEWQTPQGEKRSTMRVTADHVGLNLTRHAATSKKHDSGPAWGATDKSAEMPF